MGKLHRETTKIIKIGSVKIGGGNPVLIQSMTNTDTADVAATVKQILELEEAGCQIVRSTANTMEAACAFDKLTYQSLQIYILIIKWLLQQSSMVRTK